mgnify:CR=1 FL=1
MEKETNTSENTESHENIGQPITKRKRGRPKGSTNKGKANTISIPRKAVQKSPTSPTNNINSRAFVHAFTTIISLVDERLQRVNRKIACKVTC